MPPLISHTRPAILPILHPLPIPPPCPPPPRPPPLRPCPLPWPAPPPQPFSSSIPAGASPLVKACAGPSGVSDFCQQRRPGDRPPPWWLRQPPCPPDRGLPSPPHPWPLPPHLSRRWPPAHSVSGVDGDAASGGESGEAGEGSERVDTAAVSWRQALPHPRPILHLPAPSSPLTPLIALASCPISNS